MIIVLDNDGNVVLTSDATINQGDSAVGRVYVVSPFPNNVAMTVSFTLPNGKVTDEYALAVDIGETGELLDKFRPVVYKLTTPSDVFSIISGRVGVQLYAYSPIGEATINPYDSTTWSEKKALDPTSLTVIKGNYVLPDTPPSDKWDSLLLAYSDLASEVVELLGKYGLSVFIYKGAITNAPVVNGRYNYTDALTQYYNERAYQQGQLIIDNLNNMYVCIAEKNLVNQQNTTVANGVQFVLSVKGKTRVEEATITAFQEFEYQANLPYRYRATVALKTPLYDSNYVELFNDNPTRFAKYGFAIGAVRGQYVEVWAIALPPRVTLTFGIGEIKANG